MGMKTWCAAMARIKGSAFHPHQTIPTRAIPRSHQRLTTKARRSISLRSAERFGKRSVAMNRKAGLQTKQTLMTSDLTAKTQTTEPNTSMNVVRVTDAGFADCD